MPVDKSQALPAGWVQLRQRVRENGRLLSWEVWQNIQQIFLDGTISPRELTREYGQDEYLQVLGRDGHPTGMEKRLLDGFHEAVNAHSELSKWFFASTLHQGVEQARNRSAQPVLLAGRWLCHLIGLRHGTVEVFLDLPGMDGHTLVQVRGMEKVEAPGAFDIPCAGHISGVDVPLESLRKELREELNLSLDDLEGLHLVREYLSPARPDSGSFLINEEYRYLYRARVKNGALNHLHFLDGEVAGLSLFNLMELRQMAKSYPERIASGLGDALKFYT